MHIYLCIKMYVLIPFHNFLKVLFLLTFDVPYSDSLSSSVPYNFTTITWDDITTKPMMGPVDEADQGLWTTELKGLRAHTAYTIVVKAFNSEGAGPLSPPVTVSTMEDGEGSEIPMAKELYR